MVDFHLIRNCLNAAAIPFSSEPLPLPRHRIDVCLSMENFVITKGYFFRTLTCRLHLSPSHPSKCLLHDQPVCQIMNKSRAHALGYRQQHMLLTSRDFQRFSSILD